MKKRTIMVRYEIDDNDLIEQKLFDSLDCSRLKDFYVLPDTDELYENDATFRELSMKLKASKRYYNDYIKKKKLNIKE